MTTDKNLEHWLDNADMKRLFHVSTRTLQSWRSSGILPFAKICGKIFYKKSDVETLLEASYRSNNAKKMEE